MYGTLVPTFSKLLLLAKHGRLTQHTKLPSRENSGVLR